MPRREGMERKDLLKANVKIFATQGKALDEFGKKTCKVRSILLYEAFIYTIHFQYLRLKLTLPCSRLFHYLPFKIFWYCTAKLIATSIYDVYHCGSARFSLGIHKRCTRLLTSCVVFFRALIFCKSSAPEPEKAAVDLGLSAPRAVHCFVIMLHSISKEYDAIRSDDGIVTNKSSKYCGLP